jgi:hypothetical protein
MASLAPPIQTSRSLPASATGGALTMMFMTSVVAEQLDAASSTTVSETSYVPGLS